MLKVPEYYLNMDPETIANYCFYAKSQNEKMLTRAYINIYYNKNQPQPKSSLKVTGRTFFGTASQSVRDRTYSDNASFGLPTLEPAPKSQLKSSESTDKLKKALEEEKVFRPMTETPKKQLETVKREESDEIKIKQAEAKKSIEKAPEASFRETPKAKNTPAKKTKKNRKRNKKVSQFLS